MIFVTLIQFIVKFTIGPCINMFIHDEKYSNIIIYVATSCNKELVVIDPFSYAIVCHSHLLHLYFMSMFIWLIYMWWYRDVCD